MTFSDYIKGLVDFKYFESRVESEVLIVFLPAVNSKGLAPYFPRISWAKDLSDGCNLIYLSDPWQHLPEYDESKGSWFVSKNGKSILPEISKAIQRFSESKGFSKILYYGSSMGGYSSTVLSLMHPGSSAIAECPQLFLSQHPGSRYVLDAFCDRDNVQLDPGYYILDSDKSNIFIFCSIKDIHHQKQHILPFFDQLKGYQGSSKFYLYSYLDNNYSDGHVSMTKDDAFLNIFNVLEKSQ